MIDAEDLRTLIVKPTIAHLGLASPAAENLLLGIAAVESGMGHWLKQRGAGPALGVWQIEPFTHADIWRTYLAYRGDLAARVLALVPPIHQTGDHDVPVSADALVDLRYGCAIARIKLKRSPEPLPAAGDWASMAVYHKRFYNTSLGATTTGEFERACRSCGLID